MADKLVPSKDDTGVIEKYVDNGDGSWSRKVALGGGAVGAAGYPAGATPVQSGDNQANAALSASLPAAVGKTTYLTGLSISGGGSTAGAAVAGSLTGLLGGTRAFTVIVPAGALVPMQPLTLNFNPPLPASGLNTAIALSVGAGGAGNAGISAMLTGFQA